MKSFIATLAAVLVGVASPALAQNLDDAIAHAPTQMGERGADLNGKSPQDLRPFDAAVLAQIERDLPTNRLSRAAGQRFLEVGIRSRSASDEQVYRSVSPSVVMVLTKEGIGSGSILNAQGEIITNWHVVQGHNDVGVELKPAIEGQAPNLEDINLAHVVKYDEVADLALIKLAVPRKGMKPICLGKPDDVSIGADVHAIGHPTGEAWTYTKGVISQYRIAYGWTVDDGQIKHKANVIQTQTPINPGNSGGPLVSEAGCLIGINSFKGNGEGLNFAISIDDVNDFLSRVGNREAPNHRPPAKQNCISMKKLYTARNKQNDATVSGYDIDCSETEKGEYVVPDDESKPYMFLIDRNSDGKPDVIIFDFKRSGKWDISVWDGNFDGHWTLVGHHPDGGLIPSSFESFEAFEKRSKQQ